MALETERAIGDRVRQVVGQTLGEGFEIGITPSERVNEFGLPESTLTVRRRGYETDPSYTYTSNFTLFNTEDNEMFLERAGVSSEGFDAYRGDVVIGKAGTSISKPFTTGLESFATRLRSNYDIMQELEESGLSGGSDKDTIHGLMYDSKQSGQAKEGIPPSSIYVGPNASVNSLRYISGTRNVIYKGLKGQDEIEQAQRIFFGQVNTPPGRSESWRFMYGGGLYHEDTNQFGSTSVFVGKSSLGMVYDDELGVPQIDVLRKNIATKGAYVGNRRDIATPYLRSQEGVYSPVQAGTPGFQTLQVSERETDQPRVAPVANAFYPGGGLPMPGGYSKQRLPVDLQAHLTQADSTLSFGFRSFKKAGQIEGINNIGDLLDKSGRLIFNPVTPEIGREVGAKKPVVLGTYGGDKEISFTAGIRPLAVTKPVMVLPSTWWGTEVPKEGDAPQEDIARIIEENRIKESQLEQLQTIIRSQIAESGGDPDIWEFRKGQAGRVTVGAVVEQFGPSSVKSEGAKGFSSLPFVGGAAQAESFRIEDRVSRRKFEAQSGVPEFEFLTEPKSPAAIMMGTMRTFSQEKMSQLVQELYSENEGLQQARDYIDQRQGTIGIQNTAKALGFNSDVAFVEDAYNKLVRPGQRLTQEESARQKRNIQEYGIGRVSGWTMIGQATPDNRKTIEKEILSGLMDPRWETSGNPYISNLEDSQKAAWRKSYLSSGTQQQKRTQARKFMNQVFNFQRTSVGGETVYNIRQFSEGLFARRPMDEVTEYAGEMDTVDPFVEQALISQKFGDVVGWLKKNQFSNDDPSRAALKKLRVVRTLAAAAASAGQASSVMDSGIAYNVGFTQGTAGFTAQEFEGALAATMTGTSVDRLGEIKDWYNERVGRFDVPGFELTPMHMPRSGVILPSPELGEQIDVSSLQRNEAGLLQEATQSHISDRLLRLYQRAAALETAETIDPVAARNLNEEVGAFLSRQTSNRSLDKYQTYQGISGRYAGDPLIPQGTGFIPNRELARMANAFNVPVGKMAQAYNNLPAILMRDPMPVLGTNEYAGAVRPIRLMTSASKYGAMLEQALGGTGRTDPAQIYLPPFTKAEQGDLDADPMRLIPLGVMLPGGRMERYIGGDYTDFMKRTVSSLSEEDQSRIHKLAFGGGEVAYKDPVQEPMLKALLYGLQTLENEKPGSTDLAKMNREYGSEGRPWMSEESYGIFSGDIQKYSGLQEELKRYTENKKRLMGADYNVYRRWSTAAGSSLGMSTDWLTRAADFMPKAYQEAIDLKGQMTPLVKMMQSIGIYRDPTAEKGKAPFKFGMMTSLDDQAKFDYSLQWNPFSRSQEDPRRFFTAAASFMASNKDDSAEAISYYLTQADKNVNYETDTAAAETLEQRRRTVQETIEGVRAQNLPEKEERFALNAAFGKLYGKTGDVIGWRSIAGEMLLTQGVSRTSRSDRGEKAIPLDEFGGWGPVNIPGEQPMSYEKFAQRQLPTQTMFDFLRGFSENQRSMQWNLPQYLWPQTVARTMLAAKERGVSDNFLTDMYYRQIAAPLGIGKQGGMIRVPGEKEPRQYSTLDQFNEIMSQWKNVHAEQYNLAFNPERELSGGNLSSSSIGALSSVYRNATGELPGNIYQYDPYRVSIQKGLDYGVNVVSNQFDSYLGAPASAFFGQASDAPILGHEVENTFARTPGSAGLLGIHVGNPPELMGAANEPRWRYQQGGKDYWMTNLPDFMKIQADKEGNIQNLMITDVKNLRGTRGMSPEQIWEGSGSFAGFKETESYPLQGISYMMGARAMGSGDITRQSHFWDFIQKRYREQQIAAGVDPANIPALKRESLRTAKIGYQWAVSSVRQDELDELQRKAPTMSEEDLAKQFTMVPFGELGEDAGRVADFESMFGLRVEQAEKGAIVSSVPAARYGSQLVREELVRRGFGNLNRPDPEIHNLVKRSRAEGEHTWTGMVLKTGVPDEALLGLYKSLEAVKIAGGHYAGSDPGQLNPQQRQARSQTFSNVARDVGSLPASTGGSGNRGGGGDSTPPTDEPPDPSRPNWNGEPQGGQPSGGNSYNANWGDQIPVVIRELIETMLGRENNMNIVFSGRKLSGSQRVALAKTAFATSAIARQNLPILEQKLPDLLEKTLGTRDLTEAITLAQTDQNIDIGKIISSDPDIRRAFETIGVAGKLARQATSSANIGTTQDVGAELYPSTFPDMMWQLQTIAGGKEDWELNEGEKSLSDWSGWADILGGKIPKKQGTVPRDVVSAAAKASRLSAGAARSKFNLKTQTGVADPEKIRQAYEAEIEDIDSSIADLDAKREELMSRLGLGKNQLIRQTKTPKQDRRAAEAFRSMATENEIIDPKEAEAYLELADVYEKKALLRESYGVAGQKRDEALYRQSNNARMNRSFVSSSDVAKANYAVGSMLRRVSAPALSKMWDVEDQEVMSDILQQRAYFARESEIASLSPEERDWFGTGGVTKQSAGNLLTKSIREGRPDQTAIAQRVFAAFQAEEEAGAGKAPKRSEEAMAATTRSMEEFTKTAKNMADQLEKGNPVYAKTVKLQGDLAIATEKRTEAEAIALDTYNQLSEAKGLKPATTYQGAYEAWRGRGAGVEIPAQMVQEMESQFGKAEVARGQEFDAGLSVKEEEGGRGWAGITRRALGGFGLMYMRSLYNVATSGLDTGYQERIQADRAAMRGVGSAAGTGAMILDPEAVYQNSMMQIGGAGRRAMRLGIASILNPTVSAVGGSALAGVSAFGLTQQIGAWAPGAAEFAATQLGKTGIASLTGLTGSAAMGVVGAGVGLGAMALVGGMQVAGAARDVAGSANALATQKSPFSVLPQIAASLGDNDIAITAQREARGLAYITGDVNYLKSFSLPGAGSSSSKNYAQYMEDYIGKNGTTTIKEALMRTGYVSQAEQAIGGVQLMTGLSAKYPEIPMEAFQTAFFQMQKYGIKTTDENIKSGAAFAIGGINVEGLASTMSAVGGKPISEQFARRTELMEQFYGMGGVEPVEMEKMLAGANLISQLGSSAFYSQTMNQPSPEMISRVGNLPVPNQEVYLSSMKMWESGREAGFQWSEPSFREAQMTQEEIGIQKARDRYRGAQITSRENLEASYSSTGRMTVDEARSFVGSMLSGLKEQDVLPTLQIATQTQGVNAQIQQQAMLTGAMTLPQAQAYAQSWAGGTYTEQQSVLQRDTEEGNFLTRMESMFGMSEDQIRGTKFFQDFETSRTAGRENKLETAALATEFSKNLQKMGWSQDVADKWSSDTMLNAPGAKLRDMAQRSSIVTKAGESLMQTWGLSATGSQEAMQRMSIGMDQVPTWQLETLAGVAQYNPQSLTLASAKGLPIPWMGNEPLPWQMVPGEIGQFGSMAGIPTGNQLFTSTMQIGNPEANTATTKAGLWGWETMSMLFGQDWKQSKFNFGMPTQAGSGQNKNLLEAMVSGITVQGANDFMGGSPLQLGGTQALQWMSMQNSYEMQMAQIANQTAQLQAGYAFQTGVGLSAYSGTTNPQTGKTFNLPAGGMWGVQDRQRELGYAQTEWGFEMQQRQLELSSNQFQENFAVNKKQSMMQRQWAQQDWGYQDQVRGLQWQWKQEDYQENVRFMTGRERRLSERQMRRDTTMHDIEGDQINKQRDRQQEMWKLEDERFKLQQKQHEENKKLQQESIDKQREFFEQRKRLEEQMVQLQRAQYVVQHQLQLQAIAAQAKYAEQQQRINEMMLILGIAQADFQGVNKDLITEISKVQSGVGAAGKEAVSTSEAVFQVLLEYLDKILKKAGGRDDDDSGSGGGGAGNNAGNCFVAETLVSTKDGYIRIADVVSGMMVYSWNEDSKCVQLKTVIGSSRDIRSDLVDVETSDGKFRCSPNHRWYTKRGWITADKLSLSDKVFHRSNKWIKVISVTSVSGAYPVFNFEVEENHNYFVLDHLVHNRKTEEQATGGSWNSGDIITVADGGSQEILRPNGAGQTIPVDGSTNPWVDVTMFVAPQSQAKTPAPRVTIYIGNERLGEFVIDQLDKEIRV